MRLCSDRDCDTLVFAAFSFFRFFSFLPLYWFLSTSLDLNLSIFSFHAQVTLDPNPCQCHSSDPHHPCHQNILAKYSFFLLKGIFLLFEVCEATPVYVAP